MSNSTVIVEGCLKYRDGRKWKSRWAVITKLSPVADCLHLQIYRDSKDRCKNGTTKSSLSLNGFLALETGFTLEKESNTIAIICKDLVVVLAFDTREVLIQWEVKIKAHLSEEQHFLVQITTVPPKSKLSCGPSRLHLQDHTFSLVSGIPPRLLAFWPIKELRRFGEIDGKFCFEGGSNCGKGVGPHVLHTNQSKELTKCFELALNGKLHGKRRLSSNKNSSIDGSVRMSLQQTKCHKSCESGSNESSRPLISSSSESSVCDACSQIIRFNSSNPNFESELSGESSEHYSSRSTCSTILRCSSNLSCSADQSYLCSGDNDCFLSSHSSQTLNNCADNRCSIKGLSNIDCNTLPKCTQNDNNRCSLALSPCVRCGHHYCTDIYDCSADDVLSTKTQTNKTISAINLSEFRSMSTSSFGDCLRHNHQMPNHKNGSILPDRASLCSQSSHSSGGSNSSHNSSGSHSSGHSCHFINEYSVPRSQHKSHIIVDMLYDKPKNIQHKICNIVNKTEQISLCSCHLDQLDVTNKNTFNSSHKITPIALKANTLPENCNHLSIMSSKDLNGFKCQPIEEFGQQHYAVPRTALANIYLKELKQSQNCLSDNMMKNNVNYCGDQYDFPRKFQESMSQPLNQSNPGVCSCALSSALRKRNSSSSFDSNASNGCNSGLSTDTNRIFNNNTILTNNSYQNSVIAINQCMVSSHQTSESNNCMESQVLTPLGVQRVETINRQIECRPGMQFALNGGNCAETIGVNKVKDKSVILGQTQQCYRSECMPKVNVINEVNNGLTDCCLKANQSTSLQKYNYVNMQFMQSLPLYENIEFIPYKNLVKYNTNKGPLKEPMPSLNEQHYEMMSVLNDTNLRKSINSIERQTNDNYIPMHPIVSNKTTSLETKTSHKSRENILVNPSIQQLIQTVNTNKSSLYEMNGIQWRPINSLKKRLSYHRSNSTERRRDEHKYSISSLNSSSCPPSPALTSKSCLKNRQFFISSKFTYKSKDKSFSIDDISTAQLSQSHSHYLKFGHKIAFHKSADCLKQRTDDYRSSEEDLCTSSQITVLCASPARADIRPSIQVLSDCCDVVVADSNRLKTDLKSDKNLNECLNSVDSTSSSDMSDYIECLSLSSRTSSGSDPTYVRSEDLLQKTQSINSALVEPKQEYSVIPKTIDSMKGMVDQTHSPSPGYESENSSPFL